MVGDMLNEDAFSTVEKHGGIQENFRPNILAFACHYCAFAAADLAGVMRLTYPTSVKVIRIPCTGKLDHVYVLRAFECGIDGVFVAGCLSGQCHFREGNTAAIKRVIHLKKLLEDIHIDPLRLEMYNLSASQGPKWAEICNIFTERIRKLGPSPIRIAKGTATKQRGIRK